MPTLHLTLVTAPDPETAKALCRALLGEGLIACGSIVPAITSIYRWEGAVREEGESLMILKADREVSARLRERIAELHPYTVPEILSIPIEGGHLPYLEWVAGETRPAEG